MPGGHRARRQQDAVLVHLHVAVRLRPRPELVAVAERDRDVRAVQRPAAGGGEGPDLNEAAIGVVQDFDHAVAVGVVALGFEQEVVFPGAGIHLREGDVRLLVCAEGCVPEDVGVPAAGCHVQFVRGDGAGGGVTRPVASDASIGAVEGVEDGGGGEGGLLEGARVVTEEVSGDHENLP